jgi:hypothetical protein
MRGLLVTVVALFYKGLTNRYWRRRGSGQRAAESA